MYDLHGIKVVSTFSNVVPHMRMGRGDVMQILVDDIKNLHTLLITCNNKAVDLTPKIYTNCFPMNHKQMDNKVKPFCCSR